MNKTLVRITFLCAGVLVGFGAIFLVLDNLYNANEDPQKSDLSVSDDVEKNFNRPATSDIHPITSIEVPDRIVDLVLPDQLFDLKVAITSWVSVLEHEQVLDWLNQSTQNDWQVSVQIRTELQTALVQKLMQSSLHQALEFSLARLEPIRSTLGSLVLFEWASTDLQGAMDSVKSLPAEDRYWILNTILTAQGGLTREEQTDIARELGDEAYALTFYFQSLLTDQDVPPKDQWYEIMPLVEKENRQHLDILEAVAVSWIKQDGIEMFDEMRASIPDTRTLESVAFSVLFGNLAEDPEYLVPTFEYTYALEDDFPWKGFILRSIIAKWAREDPAAVMQRTESLPPGEYRDDMVQEAYQELAIRKPESILADLDAIPRPHREYTSQTAIRTLGEKAPHKAADIVLKVEDTELQKSLATTFLWAWVRTDAIAVKNWVLNLPVENTLRDFLLAPLADSLADSEPHLAFEIALEQSLQINGDDVHGHEVNVLQRIAQNDVDTALVLLSQVREEVRFSGYSRVTNMLIDKGKSRDAIELINELKKEEQLEWIERNLWKWSERDPAGLLNNLDSVISSEVQSQMAMTLFSMNQHSDTYSEEELSSLKQYIDPEIWEALNNREAVQLETEDTP
ncbi:MAG: hypothetical protein OXH84_03510 [Gammaproteobacteria bacterium]|nr:hypothetical protein [Gammaproteobacteria bacterium]